MTYDDDMEDLVQGFCAMEEVYGSDTPAWLRQGCRAIMGARKRDIVGLLLGKELNPGVVPSIRATVCRDMVQACPTDVADWAPAADAPQVPKVGPVMSWPRASRSWQRGEMAQAVSSSEPASARIASLTPRLIPNWHPWLAARSCAARA